MHSNSTEKSHVQTVLILAGLAAVAAVLRYFVRGWIEPLGVPTIVGSLLASVTVVLIVALVLVFLGEGRKPQGRYIKAAAWYSVLALWCESLVVAGILITERTGASTYYQGPWEAVHQAFPTSAAHAIGHAKGFVFRLAVWLILGAIIYAVAKRRRAKLTQPAAA